MFCRLTFFICLFLAVSASTMPSHAADRHEEYYYPKITSSEIYNAKRAIIKGSNKRRRVAFIVGLTDEMLKRPYAPDYAIFAKGEGAEKMLITSLRAGFIENIYQARGFLAQLTAQSRGTELFAQLRGEDTLTFWDLAAMLGFELVTITDGENYAHQVTLKR